jgi:hypothetical protein
LVASLSSRRGRPRRRGIAVLLVLLMLAATLGLSYAAMRGQGTTLLVQKNAGRRAAARQIAITGLTMALKKMQTNAWGGVNTTLTGQFSTYETFAASYATGDPRLSAANPDYADFPWRVTVLCTGSVKDPDNPQCVATHTVRAIVRLVPRQLGAEPDWWTSAISYRVYQYNPSTVTLNLPVRFEGRMRVEGTLYLANGIGWPSNIRSRYFGDLNQMRSNGFPDWRPLSDAVKLPYYLQDVATVPLLGTLGLGTIDGASNAHSFPSDSWQAFSYKLYPGGKTYNAATIVQDQQATAYTPSIADNPLGLLYRAGMVKLKDDVTIRGTLITARSAGGDVEITGKRVRIEGVSLPPLYGTSDTVQLPAIVSGDDVRINDSAELTVAGMVACYDDFIVAADNQDDILVNIAGQLVAGDILVYARSEWSKSGDWWGNRFAEFQAQEAEVNGIRYWPQWLSQFRGLNPAPRITVKPPATPVRYHWHSGTNTIFVPHADDPGLRWELLDWTERL